MTSFFNFVRQPFFFISTVAATIGIATFVVSSLPFVSSGIWQTLFFLLVDNPCNVIRFLPTNDMKKKNLVIYAGFFLVI